MRRLPNQAVIALRPRDNGLSQIKTIRRPQTHELHNWRLVGEQQLDLRFIEFMKPAQRIGRRCDHLDVI